MSLFIIFPVGAMLIGLAFAIGAYRRRNVIPWITAALWVIYGIYESLMYAKILCTGECNIRVDLLMIYPLLLVVSLFGIISIARK